MVLFMWPSSISLMWALLLTGNRPELLPVESKYFGPKTQNLPFRSSCTMAQSHSFDFVIFCFLVFLIRHTISTDKPKPFVPGLVRQHGAFVQKWEGVDDVMIDKLLQDSRYPYMPTWSGYLLNFAQPSNWGDNYGSRIRTYFVPLQTGYHVFYLQSNNEGRLYLSPDVNEHHKSLIASVSGIRATGATETNKYDEQKSFPVLLQKGHYYYMETLMSENFNEDVLDVAVKTPDNKMHLPITSEFLWTDVPDNATALTASNSISQQFFWKLTARTAARFGYAAGQSSGAINGAKAGAKAGAIAGKEYGAKIGAEAGRNIAKNIMTNAITLTLKADPRSSGGVVNLFTNSKDNVAVDKEAVKSILSTNTSSLVESILASVKGEKAGIGVEGSSRATSSKVTGKSVETGTSAGIEAGTGAVVGVGAGAGIGVGVGAEAGAEAGTGAEAARVPATSFANSSVNVSSTYGLQSQRFPSSKNQAETVIKPFLPLDPNEMITPSGFLNPNYGFIQASFHSVKLVIQPQPGEDATAKARTAVGNLGFAEKVVKGGYYKILSMDRPAVQTNESRNLCLKSIQSRVSFRGSCHVFKIWSGFVNNIESSSSKETIAFESACVPGYFIRQKNYRFVLAQPERTPAFTGTASFIIYHSSKYPDAFQIRNKNQGIKEGNWYMCEDPNDDGSKATQQLRLEAQMDISKNKLIASCLFYFLPLAKGESPLQNCKDVVHVSEPKIPGHKVKATSEVGSPKKKEVCVLVKFINKAGIPFQVQSDLSDETFLIKQGSLRFKNVVKRPELHRLVMFRASDPTSKYIILLSGARDISLTPTPNCDSDRHYVDVIVTSKPDPKAGNKSMRKPLPAVNHIHYHYSSNPKPKLQPTACSPTCTSGPVCPWTCSQVCCKKDEVTFVEAKSKITKKP